jgi:hypothetical protein
VIHGKDRWNFTVKNHLGMPDSCAGKSITNLYEKIVPEEEQFNLEFFVPFVSNTYYLQYSH